VNHKSRHENGDAGNPVLACLNLIDRLYLIYLAVITVLAVFSGRSVAVLVLAHAAIALVIVLLAAHRCRSAALRFVHDWYPLAMFIFTFEEVARFSLVLVPRWQDFRLISIEQHLFSGLPNLWSMQYASRALSEFMDLGYFSYYPLFPVVAGVLYARKDKQPFRGLVLASVLMYLISFTVYLLFPTQGPRQAVPGFHAPPSGWFFSFLVHLIQGSAGVHGNALPSSHVALGVLCGWASYKNARKLFPYVAACTCLISAGAVYDGYHYASDVLAGLLVALITAALVDVRARLRDSSLNRA
jgi:membrane-associated phospholipid phosphatase